MLNEHKLIDSPYEPCLDSRYVQHIITNLYFDIRRLWGFQISWYYHRSAACGAYPEILLALKNKRFNIGIDNKTIV